MSEYERLVEETKRILAYARKNYPGFVENERHIIDYINQNQYLSNSGMQTVIDQAYFAVVVYKNHKEEEYEDVIFDPEPQILQPESSDF